MNTPQETLLVEHMKSIVDDAARHFSVRKLHLLSCDIAASAVLEPHEKQALQEHIAGKLNQHYGGGQAVC